MFSILCENEFDLWEDGGINYEKLPLSLINKYPAILKSKGIGSDTTVALYIKEERFFLPMIISLNELKCSVLFLSEKIFFLDQNYILENANFY